MVHSMKFTLRLLAFKASVRELGHAHSLFLLIIQLRLFLPASLILPQATLISNYVSLFIIFHSIKYFPTLTNPRYLVVLSGLNFTLRYSRKCFLLTWPIILLVSKNRIVLYLNLSPGMFLGPCQSITWYTGLYLYLAILISFEILI